jgi:hypothetical protein
MKRESKRSRWKNIRRRLRPGGGASQEYRRATSLATSPRSDVIEAGDGKDCHPKDGDEKQERKYSEKED